jgi:tetratricopeptide (TPR) repeat protein
MKWLLISLAATVALAAVSARAEHGAIDLPPLVKKTRAAVMMLITYDKDGNELSTGTGFLVSADGKLVTNHHVVAGAHRVTAKAENGRQYLVLGALAEDADADLALLKLDGGGFSTLTLSASDGVEPGTRVVVIGSPYGLEGSISEGIISATHRKLEGESKRKHQMTAAVSPGSSGSPVLNERGEVIGVATLIYEGQSINFAVPVEDVKALLARARPTNKLLDISSVQQTPAEEIADDLDYFAALDAVTPENGKEVLAHAQTLVRRYPKNYVAHHTLGFVYSAMERNADAIASFKQAVELGPKFADAWYSLGLAYDVDNRTADAIAAYQKAIALKPEYVEALAALGHAYLQTDRHADAVTAFENAVKSAPDNAEALEGLASACHLRGQKEKAQSALRQLRLYHPLRAEKLAPELQ